MSSPYHKALVLSNQDLRHYYNQHPNPAVSFLMFLKKVRLAGQSLEQAISCKEGGVRTETKTYRDIYEALAPGDRAVSFDIFYKRVIEGWKVSFALVTPTANKVEQYRQHYKKYPKPSVSYRTYLRRVLTLGWTPKQAALTAPRLNYSQGSSRQPKVKQKGTLRRRVPLEVINYYYCHQSKAQVSLKTYVNRVHGYCWDKERALLTPIKARAIQSTCDLQQTFMQLCRPLLSSV